MMSQNTIRRLSPNDAEAMRTLRLRGLQERPDAFGSSYEEEIERDVEWFGGRLSADEQGDNAVFGAFDAEGTLVGMTGFVREHHLKMRHRGWVWGVYVVPEARGKGFAGGLMEAVIAHARGIDGLEQVELSVAAGNESAKRLYLKYGFVEWGHQPRMMKIGETYIDEAHLVLFLTEVTANHR